MPYKLNIYQLVETEEALVYETLTEAQVERDNQELMQGDNVRVEIVVVPFVIRERGVSRMKKPNCIYCQHKEVCGMYNALWDAMLLMDNYDCLAKDYESELSYTLADNCNQFKRAKSEEVAG